MNRVDSKGVRDALVFHAAFFAVAIPVTLPCADWMLVIPNRL